MTTTTKHWNPSQVKGFARNLRKEIGEGWDYMVPAVRRAMVDSFILGIIRSQHRESVTIEAMDELHEALHAAMGTTD